ncbi:unnamed protein product, partial [Ectocarpus sp. 8 AP-2014]
KVKTVVPWSAYPDSRIDVLDQILESQFLGVLGRV